MSDLLKKRCRPCEGLGQALTLAETQSFLKDVPHWVFESSPIPLIRREFLLKNFDDAFELLSCIAVIAQQEDHHPDLHLVSYRTLIVELHTHALKGLSENDFIVASRINALERGEIK